MIPKIREAFNAGFNEAHYERLQKEVLETFGEPCPFRISETPVFIDREMREKVHAACNAILEQLDGLENDLKRNLQYF